MSMYEVIGTSKSEPLLADAAGSELIAIPMVADNDVVARGTVVYRNDEGLYAPADSAAVVDTNYLLVLDEAVDTTSESIPVARAYIKGNLLADTVKLKDGSALTADMQLTLRKQGLVLKQMVPDTIATEPNN